MFGSRKCPCCGYQIAVPSSPYSDASIATIESLTREVEYLRLVVKQHWPFKLNPGGNCPDAPATKDMPEPQTASGDG